MQPRDQLPPRWAQRLLMAFLRADLAEEVLGDLDEKFYRLCRTTTVRYARFNYWYQVFNYMRPFAIRKTSPNTNSFAMISSYFKIGWRSMSSQRLYSAIKIGGFALGIAACILIGLFVRDEVSYDKSYPDGERLYRVIGLFNEGGTIDKGVSFPAPFGPSVKEDYPEVETTARLNSSELFGAGGNEIRRTDQEESNYEEQFVFADKELPTMLSFPMIYGKLPDALAKANTLLLSRRMADKYFPGENPIGQTMIINNNQKTVFTVGGVMENIPATSHLAGINFIITMTGVEFWPGEQTEWMANNYFTYVKLRPGTDPVTFEKKLMSSLYKYALPLLRKERADADEIIKKAGFALQPVADIHLKSYDIDGAAHGDIRYVWLFTAIAGFILVIACINFINLSTAKSANRAKEVGLRKVVGSVRSNLVGQFLTESVLFSLCSFVLGLMLAWALLPFFNAVAGKEIEMPWQSWWMLPGLALVIVLIGVIAGMYPAIYLSSFRPVQVLKGNVSRGSKSSAVRSVLVVFQFVTSIVLIVGTFIVYTQMNYVLNTKVGFDKEQVLLLQGTATLGDKMKTFKEELMRVPGVKQTSASGYLPINGMRRNGNAFFKGGKYNIDKPVYGQMWRVDTDYLKTLGMKVIDGRDFLATMASDSQAVVINQAMAKALELKEPVGTAITNGQTYTVIGIVEDFNFENMKQNIEPLAMTLGNNNNVVSIKFNTADVPGLIAGVTKVWKQFAPHQSIRYSFLDDHFANMYADVQRMGTVFTGFSVLAIVVACLGLFALSAFMIEQRGKEISIRLVLGASVNTIFRMLTQNFMALVAISVAIALPLGYYLKQRLLQEFAYKAPIGWEVFAGSAFVVLAIALVTISFQSLRAAVARPAERLRSE